MEGATRLRQPQEHTPAAPERGAVTYHFVFRLLRSYDIIEDVIDYPSSITTSHLVPIVDAA